MDSKGIQTLLSRILRTLDVVGCSITFRTHALYGC